MHLAGVAWQKLAENQRSLFQSTSKFADFAKLETKPKIVHGRLSPTFDMIEKIFNDPYTAQALRLAGLLHDLGHSPYSHSGEGFMPSWDQMLSHSKNYPQYISDYLKLTVSRLKSAGKDTSKIKVRHEVYTLLLIDEVLNNVFNQDGTSHLNRVYPQDVASIIITDIPPRESSTIKTHGVQFICHELVSGELDVDRMDYLLRDSRECGVVYGIFDESRILNSLAVYWDDKSQSVHLAIQFSGLAAFEDYLRARHSMYLQLYFHKTSVAAEAMIQKLTKMINGWTFPLDAKKYAEIDEHNFPDILIEAGKKQIGDKNDRVYFERLIRDLMYDRNLWKRVFEVNSTSKSGNSFESIDEAATVVASLGYKFEKVSSTNSLTRFRPRDSNSESRHYMRLIKKDDFQFPRVTPIEDYLSLVDVDSRINISRIYVEGGLNSKGNQIQSHVKEELQKLVRS
jgi:HD superfamily phosphohydrolase